MWNAADLLVLALLAASLCLSVYLCRRARRKGQGCLGGGDCASCAACPHTARPPRTPSKRTPPAP